MKKLLALLLFTALLGCQPVEVMTNVDMPKGWTLDEGQNFLNKMDIKKLQFVVVKKFPSVRGRKVNFNILPTVFNTTFSTGDDKGESYKYRIIVTTEDGWEKTGELKEFIAFYLDGLLKSRQKLNKIVLVDVPKGMDEYEADKKLSTLNQTGFEAKLVDAFPQMKSIPTHINIMPTVLAPTDKAARKVKIHVMAVSESKWQTEPEIEQFIAEYISQYLFAT
ncbi:hypothetical protein EXT46_03920 [Pseudoalteromonas sp. CO325X]|uniref:hypothetical protein n=1 Tax=Pseudoalteromonas sp. CO325X TaxID=1777262 RepID=UPI001022C7F1|nr:hypothetical protein [Pseudoalteromonas sp. CO325X]RZF84468.1 hypothetical protein EXT46_03920 [Pseudoalteromonas sp. CO325X]